MFRRVVSLLLLPCVLLTQSAAVLGYAHAGQRLAGHDLRPHIHTQAAPAGHDHGHRNKQGHGHHHGPGGHHHHHDDVKDAPEPDAQPTPKPEPPSDHDTDAVYVNATDAIVVERSEPTTQVESSDWLLPDSAPFAACHSAPSAYPVVCGHSPPGQFCPLYIRHLALLI